MKITTVGDHSHIIISNNGKDSSLVIANKILEALNQFKKENAMLDITNWRLERFNDVSSIEYYLFIDHKRRVRLKNAHG